METPPTPAETAEGIPEPQAQDLADPGAEIAPEISDETATEIAVEGGCPECGSGQLHRSRYRSWIERLRRHVSARRPYRCWACDWRGWMVPLPQDSHLSAIVWAGEVIPPNFAEIEAAVAVPEPVTIESKGRRTSSKGKSKS